MEVKGAIASIPNWRIIISHQFFHLNPKIISQEEKTSVIREAYIRHLFAESVTHNFWGSLAIRILSAYSTCLVQSSYSHFQLMRCHFLAVKCSAFRYDDILVSRIISIFLLHVLFVYLFIEVLGIWTCCRDKIISLKRKCTISCLFTGCRLDSH